MEMAYRERWKAEIAAMRRVLAGFGMKEECKWGKPTYTVDGKTSSLPVLFVALSLLGGFTSLAIAQESRWGSPDEETVKFMIAAERKWSDAQCSPQLGLEDFIAGDFQGTLTNGQRFRKAEAIAADPALMKLSRDCRLGEVAVRFFGDSMAIAYGAENRLRMDNGKEARRCQVWTDTWLKRSGRWQIVASQDTVVPCVNGSIR